jgi:hypothetical protein
MSFRCLFHHFLWFPMLLSAWLCSALQSTIEGDPAAEKQKAQSHRAPCGPDLQASARNLLLVLHFRFHWV